MYSFGGLLYTVFKQSHIKVWIMIWGGGDFCVGIKLLYMCLGINARKLKHLENNVSGGTLCVPCQRFVSVPVIHVSATRVQQRSRWVFATSILFFFLDESRASRT